MTSRDLLLIPGPIEFDDRVLKAMGHYSVGHTAPEFVETFSATLKQLRTLFVSSDTSAQPIVIAGSGTLGWDIAASNLVEHGEKVLVLSTGFFSDNFADCLATYGAEVDVLKADSVSESIDPAKLEAKLKQNKYKLVTITQVDTSSGVLADVKSLAKIIKELSPESLIVVDGVCSIGVEELRFDEWGIDYALTASQKGVGVPSGLSVSFISGRAIKVLESRKTPVSSYFANLNRWLPIMRNYEHQKGSYFATPPVQLIYALQESLKYVAPSVDALEERWKLHEQTSTKIKSSLTGLGIKLVPEANVRAHGLTTAYLPEGTNAADFLGFFKSQGIVIAAGIHKDIATKYFRIGHMGVTVTQPSLGHIDKLFNVLQAAAKKFVKK